jgi:hypothetical protein
MVQCLHFILYIKESQNQDSFCFRSSILPLLPESHPKDHWRACLRGERDRSTSAAAGDEDQVVWTGE